MKELVIKALIVIAYIVIVLGFMFVGIPWAVHTAFSIFGVSVSYVQAIALISVVSLILGSLKD